MEYIKLESLSFNITDGVHNTVLDDKEGNYYLLSCKNIKNNAIIYNDSDRKININTLDNLRRRSKLEKNDILITTVGTIGEIAIIKEKNPIYEFQRSVGIIKINPSLVNIKYVYYFLQSSSAKSLIASKIKGAVQKCLFLEDIRNIEIPIVDCELQQHIVDTIRSLDDKIEKIDKLIESLEKNGELLYYSIFKKTSIKKIKLYLKDIASFYNGYSYSGNELSEKSDTCLVTIKNFDRNGDFKTDGFKPLEIKGNVKPTMFCKYGDVLVAHTDLTQNAEIIGNPIIITNTSKFKKIVISMDLVKVESNTIPNELLYYILKDTEFKNFAFGYCSGTTVLHLSKKALSEYSFDYPIDTKVINELSNKLKKFLNLKCNYIKQKDKLLQLKQLYLNKFFN